jgi:hypothetical protein
LSTAWTYRLGRDLGGRWVGLGAALALGASAVMIWYMHELRNYVLIVLVTVTAIWSYWRITARQPSRGAQILFTLSIAGLLYTHYFAVLVALALALYHLLFVPKNRAWWRVPVLMALAVMLTLPWIGSTLTALNSAVTETGYYMLALTGGEALVMLAVGFSNGVLLFLMIVALGMLAVRRNPGARLIVFLAGALLVLALVIHHFVPVIKHVRHLIMLWPVLAVLFGFGVAYLARYRRVLMLVLVIWVGCGVYYSLTPDLNDYLFREEHLKFFRPHLALPALERAVAQDVQVNDAVVFSAPVESWAVSGAFEYYMDPLPVRYTLADWLPGDAADYPEQARRFVQDYPRVWFGTERHQPADFRQAAFVQLLQSEFTQCRRALDLPDLTLDLYARAPVCCGPPETAPAAVFGAIELAHIDSLPSSVLAEPLVLMLSWSLGPDVPRGTYSAALHVWDAEGNRVAQYDGGLPDAAYQCQPIQLDLTGVPPGAYQVTLTVYDWVTGARLTGTGFGASGEALLLGTLTIVED